MGIKVNAQLEDTKYIRNVQRYVLRNVQETEVFTSKGEFLNNEILPLTFCTCLIFGHRISEIVIERFFSVGLFLPDWLYHYTPGGREHYKIMNEIHDFTTKVLEYTEVTSYNLFT